MPVDYAQPSVRLLILPMASFGWGLGALMVIPSVPAGLDPGVIENTPVMYPMLIAALIGCSVWSVMERFAGAVLTLFGGLSVVVIGALGWSAAQDAEALFTWRMVALTGAVAGPVVPLTAWLMASARPSFRKVSPIVPLRLLAAAAVAFIAVWPLPGIVGWRLVGFAAVVLAGLGLNLLFPRALRGLEALSRP